MAKQKTRKSRDKAKSAYAEAGVDIDVMMNALKQAKKRITATATPAVLGGVGSFGGLHKSPGSKHVLVSSIDGVGTKLKVADLAGKHDTVGQCLVNHCTNDILVQGAHPLFFMDYLGTAQLDPKVFSDVVKGLSKACKENGCALIGGETAEMPGLYPQGEYDLVGAIVGTVERKKLITGDSIKAGDVLIGLPSSGLHTNGYSLARRVIFETLGLGVDDVLPGTRTKVSTALLAVHKSYLKPVSAVMAKIKVHGMAHITGGGLTDNLPRILPAKCKAVIDRSAWKVPALFDLIREAGGIDEDEMYRVFNMGIGMVVIVRPGKVDEALQILRKAGEKPVAIGNIQTGRKGVYYAT